MWDRSFRGTGLNRSVRFHGTAPYFNLKASFNLKPTVTAVFLLLILTLTAETIPSQAREKDVLEYGAGLIINIPLPEYEVAQVVEDVAGNTIIRGTKEYDKDEYVKGAETATSTPVFAAWTEGGKVFYKVRMHAIDPRNFKNGGDVGTLAVRYVVQPEGFGSTVLRIDARFVEDLRRTVHLSSGSVESSEYKDIQEHLDAIELIKKETAEAVQAKQERLAKQNFGMGDDTIELSTPPSEKSVEKTNDESMSGPVAAQDQPAQTLEQHVAELRRQVERVVKKPGAPLQSAPFHTASTLQSLEPGVEVLIQIATPYWYGVETREGQHGWIRRDQLEQAP
jgi:hypothetical protein